MERYKKDKLHIGCGLITPSSWLNLDGSWNAKLAKYKLLKKILATINIIPKSQLKIEWNSNIVIHNVRKPLPFEDNSFSAIYSSHLLEHLYLEDAKKLLAECFRVVKKNGVVRVMVPDLRSFVEEYINNKKNQGNKLVTADEFINKLSMREKSAPKGGIIYKIYKLTTDFHSHKWMYDGDSLAYYFRKIGFSDVQILNPHQSKITNIEEVEKREGVCVEGIKRSEN